MLIIVNSIIFTGETKTPRNYHLSDTARDCRSCGVFVYQLALIRGKVDLDLTPK